MVGDDEAPEEKLVAMGETKEASSPPLGRDFAFTVRRRRQAAARPLVGPPDPGYGISVPGDAS